MAQTGYTPILIYASGTASNTPLAANLTSSASGAELALNYADGKLFYKDSGGVVQTLATKGTAVIGGSNNQVQYNSSGSLAGSANLTFDGTNLATTGNISLGASANLTWGGAYGAGIPTIAGSGGALLFYPNGSTSGESMRLNSSGNLGLGVTPSAWFTTSSPYKAMQFGVTGSVFGRTGNEQINVATNAYASGSGSYTYIASGNFASMYQQSAGVHAWFTAPSGTAGNAITFTQAMTLDASGNLIVGGTVFAYAAANRTNIAVNGTTTAFYELQTGGTGRGYLAAASTNIELAAVGYASFVTNGAERARITSGGDLLVGTTNTSGTTGEGIKSVFVTSTVPTVRCVGNDSTSTYSSYELYSTSAAAYRFYVNYAGTVFATTTTISAISDQRLKENVQDLDAGLDKIMALKPRKFDWMAGKGKDIKGDRGFIAQEFEQVFPDLIDEWKDPAPEGEEPYKSVRQDLIPVLVKAIQEQQALIESLTARIAALEAA